MIPHGKWSHRMILTEHNQGGGVPRTDAGSKTKKVQCSDHSPITGDANIYQSWRDASQSFCQEARGWRVIWSSGKGWSWNWREESSILARQIFVILGIGMFHIVYVRAWLFFSGWYRLQVWYLQWGPQVHILGLIEWCYQLHLGVLAKSRNCQSKSDSYFTRDSFWVKIRIPNAQSNKLHLENSESWVEEGSSAKRQNRTDQKWKSKIIYFAFSGPFSWPQKERVIMIDGWSIETIVFIVQEISWWNHLQKISPDVYFQNKDFLNTTFASFGFETWEHHIRPKKTQIIIK